MKRRWLATAICAIAMTSACSGESEGNTDVGADDAKFDGSYTLMTFGPFSTAGNQGADDYDQIRVGALAAAKKINEAGGVNGKSIKIEPCDTRGDSNRAVSCAQKAVTDRLPAVVGTFEGAGEYLAVLEQGKVPAIGAVGLAGEYASSVAFPVYNGLEIYLGLFALMEQQGIDDIAFPFQNDTAGAEAGLAPIVAAGTALGLKIETIPVEPDQTDYSPVVARAAEHAGIIIGLVDKQGIPFVQSLRQTNYDGAVGGSLSAEAIETLGDLAEGIYSVNAYLPASYTENAAVKEYVGLMDGIDDKTLLDDAAANAYNSVLMFAEVADGLDDVTGPALLEKLPAAPIATGLRPPVSFAAPPASVKGAFPDLPRLFDVNVVFEQVKDGTLRPISGNFFDAITAEEVPFN